MAPKPALPTLPQGRAGAQAPKSRPRPRTDGHSPALEGMGQASAGLYSSDGETEGQRGQAGHCSRGLRFTRAVGPAQGVVGLLLAPPRAPGRLAHEWEQQVGLA